MDTESLIKFFPPLIIILVLFLAYYFHRARKKKLEAIYEKIALRRNGKVENLTWSLPRLTIRDKEHLIELHSRPGGKNRPPKTYLHSKHPSSFEFGLSNESTLNSLGKWFGAEDLKVNNHVFDDTFILKGKNESQIQQFFNPDFQQKILKLQSQQAIVRFKNGKFSLRVHRIPNTESEVEELIDAAFLFLNRLDEFK